MVKSADGRKLACLVALFYALVGAPHALATPVGASTVFDFESGGQGWLFSGSAVRTETDVLGGLYAVFGDGLVGVPEAGIMMVFDLTDVTAIVIHQFSASLGQDSTFLGLRLNPLFPGGIQQQTPIPFSADVAGDEQMRSLDLSGLAGLHEVEIVWGCFDCPGGTVPAEDAAAGYVDDITVLSIPEPRAGTLVLPAILLALRGSRLRRDPRQLGQLGS